MVDNKTEELSKEELGVVETEPVCEETITPEPDIAQIKTISINDYADTEFATFSEKPFSVVDSLVIAQLCYMNVSGVVPFLHENRQPVTIQQLYRAEYFDQFIKGIFMPSQQRKLIDYVCSSPRFRDIKVNYFVKSDDTEEEMQFSAMTFFLPTGETYVAFRGTDDSLNGWKEDFNMFYLDTIPGQISALNYLETIAGKTHGPIYIGGHSKGGNLALYAGSFAPEDIQSRIVQVFNHDGPGLSKGAKTKPGYTDIADKLNATLPHESLVGLVFSDGNYNVVASRRIGLLQHDTFRWKIYNGDFIYEKNVKPGSNKLAGSINQLMDQLDVEDREIFVDTVFEIIYSAGATNLSEFPAMAIKSRDRIAEKMKNLPTETSDLLKNIIGELIKIIASKTFSLPDIENTKLGEALSKIGDATEKLGRKMTDTAERLGRTKDKIVADSTEAIADTTEKIIRAKDKIVAESTAKIVETTEKITLTTEKLVADSAAAIADTTEKLNRTKEKLVADGTAKIAETTEKINQTKDKIVTDTAEKLSKTKNMLAEKLSGSTAKLGETTGKLSRLFKQKADTEEMPAGETEEV